MTLAQIYAYVGRADESDKLPPTHSRGEASARMTLRQRAFKQWSRAIESEVERGL